MEADMEGSLIVSGGAEFDPDDAQRTSGVAADEIWHIGEPIGKSILKRKQNAWIVSSGKMRGYELSECLDPLMSRLDACWQGMQALCARNGVDTQLSIAVYVHDTVPALDLGREVVRRMADLHADVDIDLIIVGGGEELHGAPGDGAET